VDEDNWLNLDKGSLAQEVMCVALFHLGGQLLRLSPVLSLLREKGYYRGGSQG
jgi:hypothetical protein